MAGVSKRGAVGVSKGFGECNESTQEESLETVLSKNCATRTWCLSFILCRAKPKKARGYLVSLHNHFFLLSLLFYRYPSSIFYSAKSLFNFLFGYDTPSL